MDNNEVVCPCFGITVEDIKKAINDGAKSFEDVQEATQAGTACGACIDTVKEIVDGLL